MSRDVLRASWDFSREPPLPGVPRCSRPGIQRHRTSDVRWIESVIECRFQRSDNLERSCEIWTSREPNAWENLVTYSRGPELLLIHKDTRLQEMPNLAEVLHHASFRVFAVDFGHDSGSARRSTTDRRPYQKRQRDRTSSGSWNRITTRCLVDERDWLFLTGLT